MDGNRIPGEQVYCYECHHQWRRDQGGLICPDCGSEFTEILSAPPSPAPRNAHRDPFSPQPPRPFDNHNPWADDVPDPEEGDISEWTQTGRLGGSGMFTISTRTIRSPAGRNFPPNARNHGFSGGPMMGMLPFPSETGPPGFGPFQAFSGGDQNARGAGRVPPGDDRGAQVPTGNIQDLFSLIFATMGNPQGPPGHNHPRGAATNPFAILSQLMNPANAQHGDAVFSQEALDRVISQLMEQNAGSTAPPPASEAAIQSLPTRKVEEGMMGHDGTAECSICMDDVEIGQEVTVLPCNHWFHGDCVIAWLKEHDTCPHCRKGITKPPGGPVRSQSEHPPSNSRRPSHSRTPSLTSPTSPGVEGSRRNPVTVPDSPRDLRAARQQYYESRSGGYDGRQSNRPPSHNEGRRNDDGRSGSRSSSGSNSGGVGSWIRNHMPFS